MKNGKEIRGGGRERGRYFRIESKTSQEKKTNLGKKVAVSHFGRLFEVDLFSTLSYFSIPPPQSNVALFAACQRRTNIVIRPFSKGGGG